MLASRYQCFYVAVIAEARAQFIEIDKCRSAAQCSQSLGDRLFVQGESSESFNVLTDARKQFLEIDDRQGCGACCARKLVRIKLAQSLLACVGYSSIYLGFEDDAVNLSELLEHNAGDGQK